MQHRFFILLCWILCFLFAIGFVVILVNEKLTKNEKSIYAFISLTIAYIFSRIAKKNDTKN